MEHSIDRKIAVMSWLEGLAQDDWRKWHSDSEVQNTAQDALDLLKEQEADLIAMSRFLESHGWDSDSICGKNVEIVVTNGDDGDA